MEALVLAEYDGGRLSCVATLPRRLSSGTDMGWLT
jgi:hypothetical protein